ncbi:MAG: hypothetical protein PWP23_1677 [Candidatus Sumerlaeota bacterium]|nr:hypothetical protein [Candidatus Sumerlaeota bacterium]
MFETEFDGVIWLPFVLLGLSLTIGFAVLAFLRDKKNKKARKLEEQIPRGRARTVEEELASEVAAARARLGTAIDPIPTDEEDDDAVLDLSAEEKARREEIRRLNEE